MKILLFVTALLVSTGATGASIWKCPIPGGGTQIATSDTGGCKFVASGPDTEPSKSDSPPKATTRNLTRKNTNDRSYPLNDANLIKISRSTDGHFHTLIQVGSIIANCLIDTGASSVTISPSFALTAKIKPVRTVSINGVSGGSKAYLAENVAIGFPSTSMGESRKLQVVIAPEIESSMCLIGQNFLKYFRVEMKENTMTIERING